MLIRDILNLKGGTLYSVGTASRLSDAVALMVEHDIGSLVVMSEGEMAGMLTFREVLQALNDNPGALAEMQAHEIMVRNPICGSPGDTLDELREVMTRHHIRYLPVTDRENLIGIISFHDVAKALIKETSMENRLLRRYIESQPGER